MFKIDKDVPLPTKKRKSPPAKYPFEYMEPEDSFFVLNEGMTQEALRNRIYAAANYFRNKVQKYKDWKFLVVTESTDHGGKHIYGVRCWRIR